MVVKGLEMEVWALEAHGAANTLQEMLTIKSDDVYMAVQKPMNRSLSVRRLWGQKVPENFNVLVKELQGLGLKVDLIDQRLGAVIDAEELLESNVKDERQNTYRLLKCQLRQSMILICLPILQTMNLSCLMVTEIQLKKNLPVLSDDDNIEADEEMSVSDTNEEEVQS